MKRSIRSRKKRLKIIGGIIVIISLLALGVSLNRNSLFGDEVATGGEIIGEVESNEAVQNQDSYLNTDSSAIPDDVSPDSIKNYELITENEMYKIRKLDNTYTITLYAIINRPDQADTYRDQLKEYKDYALKYLEDQGLKPSNLKIIYEPEEATNL